MLAAILIAGLAVAGIAAIWLGTAVIARHRAQSAADLAAVAAAARVPAGTTVACAQAEKLVRDMGAAIQSCTIMGLDVLVVVTVDVDRHARRRASASARAGPSVVG